MRIYVAAPLTKGDQAVNVSTAIHAADKLLSMGLTPFLPHLSCFWHLVCPRDYEEWLAYDFRWLEVCDAVLRLPGESPGADREVAYAHKRGIPVFYTLAELNEWLEAKRTCKG